MFKKTLSAALLFAVAGVASAANAPLDLSLPSEPLSDDWYAVPVTPVNTTTPLLRRGQPGTNDNAATITFDGNQLNSLRAIERRLTTFTLGDSWNVRLKPRSSSRGSLELGYARNESCPLGLTSCSITFSAQRMKLTKFIRDSYEGGEVGNFVVDELYRRPYNPMFAGERWENDKTEINMISVTFRATW